MNYNDKNYELVITNHGEDPKEPITKLSLSHTKKGAVYLLCFDLSDGNSLNDLAKVWSHQIANLKPIVLIGLNCLSSVFQE
jgi:GTPase SAR1 family protein